MCIGLKQFFSYQITRLFRVAVIILNKKIDPHTAKQNDKNSQYAKNHLFWTSPIKELYSERKIRLVYHNSKNNEFAHFLYKSSQ